MITAHTRAGFTAAGLVFATCTLPAMSGCSEKSADQSLVAAQDLSNLVSHDGRALHVQLLANHTERWTYPIDLVGAFLLKTYPTTTERGTLVVVDLMELESGLLKYRFEFLFGEAPQGLSYLGIDSSNQAPRTIERSSSTEWQALGSARLLVKEGLTLKEPLELLTLGANAIEHRFTDLAGKAKRILLIRQ